MKQLFWTRAAASGGRETPRTTLGWAWHHILEDAQASRAAFDAGVRWFGTDIQRNWAQIFLFLILPLSSVYLNQGLPTFYVGVLYFTLIASYARYLLDRDAAHHPLNDLASATRSPLAVSAAIFFLYAAVSAAWSPHPEVAVCDGLHLWAAVALMVPIIVLLPSRNRRWHLYLPFIGLAGGAVLLAIEFSPFPLLRDNLYGKNIAFMNRAVVIVAVLVWPTLAVIGGRFATVQRVLLLVLSALAIFSSMSQASMLAYIIGGIATFIAFLAPRLAAGLIWSGTVAAFAVAPFIAPRLGRILYLLGLDPYLDPSNLRRLEIWQAFSDLIFQRPFFGWGVQSSREFGARPVPGVDWTIGPAVHPHNTLIQTWLELGLVGVVLCLIAVAFLARGALDLPHRRRPYACGALAAGVAVAMVSHGMWQSWWICLIFGSVAIFRLNDEREVAAAASAI